MGSDGWSRIVKNALGLLLLAAAILGGNTVSHLNGDLLILATLAVFALALLTLDPHRIGIGPVVFAAVAIASVGIQLVPLGGWGGETIGGAFRGTFLTLNFVETARVLLSLLVALMVFFVTLTLSYSKARSLLSFMYVALYCNLLMGAVQFASRGTMRAGPFDYPLGGGFFINPNHFSTFLLVFIPFLIFSLLYETRRIFAGVTLGLLVLVLLAASSMAGVGLGLVVMLVSVLALTERRHVSSYAVLAALALTAIYLVGFQNRLGLETGVSQDTRLQFAMTTLEGIRAYFWTGVGYGTFADAYAMFMRPEDIQQAYVNHAHNDYLEVIFEGGVLALVLIVVYLAAYLTQSIVSWRDPFKRSASIAIGVMLLHSLVDYPIRTFALLFMFAVLNALLFHPDRRVKLPRSRTMEVSIGGRKVDVPFERADQRRRSV
ncbi:MAG: O-antigen ligase family protein [Aurantimonas endophytica]|uniref:O-antigen ligase family protein n=1 Tax=Aurantimonas endophytica TaxID=1522175 RepID=UPI003001E6FF